MAKTHGHRRKGKESLTYVSWKSMIQRCTNQKRDDYERYGGSGIKVYFDWVGPGGFASFLADVGRRPSRDYSLDRIDNSKSYEPGNVRWATKKVQAKNKSGKMLEAHGKRMNVYMWAEALGYHPGALRKKISRLRIRLKTEFDLELALVPNPRKAA